MNYARSGHRVLAKVVIAAIAITGFTAGGLGSPAEPSQAAPAAAAAKRSLAVPKLTSSKTLRAPRVGDTLRVVKPSSKISYRWYAEKKRLKTSSSLKLTTALIGKRIRVLAVDKKKLRASRYSAWTVRVKAVPKPPAPPAPPTFTTSTIMSQYLKVSVNRLQRAPGEFVNQDPGRRVFVGESITSATALKPIPAGPVIEYRWMRGSWPGEPIADWSSTFPAHVFSAEDRGTTLRLEVRARLVDGRYTPVDELYRISGGAGYEGLGVVDDPTITEAEFQALFRARVRERITALRESLGQPVTPETTEVQLQTGSDAYIKVVLNRIIAENRSLQLSDHSDAQWWTGYPMSTGRAYENLALYRYTTTGSTADWYRSEEKAEFLADVAYQGWWESVAGHYCFMTNKKSPAETKACSWDNTIPITVQQSRGDWASVAVDWTRTTAVMSYTK